MSPTLDNWRIGFMQAHASLFVPIADEPEHSIGCPLCEAGWRGVLERMCGRIESALGRGETLEFVRIKQKFGVLRVDWYDDGSEDTSARIGHAVDLAAARSACTCELCGAERRLYSDQGWLATRCAEHAAGDSRSAEVCLREYPLLRRWRGRPDIYYSLVEVTPDSLPFQEE